MTSESTAPSPVTALHASIKKVLEGFPPMKMWGVTLSTDEDDFHTKLILQKFLRGNKGNLIAAGKQFRETVEWRRKYFDAEGKVIGTWNHEKFAGLGWVTKENLDRSKGGDGKEVVVAWNIYGAVEDIDGTFKDVDEFLRWRVTLMERTVDLLDLGSVEVPIPDAGPDPYKAVQVHDYRQVSFLRSPPAVKAASKQAIDLFQHYYPELLDKKFMVNVPVVMGWMFSAMKILINNDTFKKVYMLSYGTGLTKDLDSETIPEEYGGKGDPLPMKGFSIGPNGELVKAAPGLVDAGGEVGASTAAIETPKEDPAKGKVEAQATAKVEQADGTVDVTEPTATTIPTATATNGDGEETETPADVGPKANIEAGAPPSVPVKNNDVEEEKK